MKSRFSIVMLTLATVIPVAAIAGPVLVLEETSRQPLGGRMMAVEASVSLQGTAGLRAIEVKALVPVGDLESLTLVPPVTMDGAVVLPARQMGDPQCEVFALVFRDPEGSAGREQLNLGSMRCHMARGGAGATVMARGVMADGSRMEIPVSYRGTPVADAMPDLMLAPNPSLGGVDVSYRVPVPSRVEVTAFDPRGRKVRSVFAGTQTAGEHSLRWDGRDDRGLAVPLGVYFVKVRIGLQVYTDRVVLVR